jgi:hypothetical protein
METHCWLCLASFPKTAKLYRKLVVCWDCWHKLTDEEKEKYDLSCVNILCHG